ncbi:MAG: type I phosphomannose isomerase catalytic subunit [Atopobiaceae bacterium]|jgi:mannose-6-phosphate isomerase
MDTPQNELIFMKPIFHNKIWGGRRLEEDFGYTIPNGTVGECWAISAHPAGDCTIENGPFAGRTLSWLWDEHRELFSGYAGKQFPLLIKILDAKENLSVQVHPDDAYAKEHEHGSLGKRECWYVLAAEPNTKIIVGQKAHNREEFAQMVKDGRWQDLLYEVPISQGDFFRIEPGCIHAIEGGTLILETQQSSDITYRVYDYDRTDDAGARRELHIAQTLDVVDFNLVAPKSGKVIAPEIQGITRLMSCPNFDVVRIRPHKYTPATLPQSPSFTCVSAVEGTGCVRTQGKDYPLTKGQHFIAPANTGDLTFLGDMTLIASWPNMS